MMHAYRSWVEVEWIPRSGPFRCSMFDWWLWSTVKGERFDDYSYLVLPSATQTSNLHPIILGFQRISS